MDNKVYSLDKLDVPARSGFVDYNGVRFHLMRDCNARDWNWGGSPGASMIMSDLGRRWKGLGVLTKEGVPEDYLDIVVAHMFIDGASRYCDGGAKKDVYSIARSFHESYAKKFKDEKTFRNFLKWRSRLEGFRG